MTYIKLILITFISIITVTTLLSAQVFSFQQTIETLTTSIPSDFSEDEESGIPNQIVEEDLHFVTEALTPFISIISYIFSFPQYLTLSPQETFRDLIKPPLMF